MFARLSAPPTPAPQTAQTQARRAGIQQHRLRSLPHPDHQYRRYFIRHEGINVPVNAFSDFLVHNMGSGLADHISQGNANGNEFRTAPLWGVGQRIFFLHDGRTSNLVEAIKAHQEPWQRGQRGNQQFRKPVTHAKAKSNAIPTIFVGEGALALPHFGPDKGNNE